MKRMKGKVSKGQYAPVAESSVSEMIRFYASESRQMIEVIDRLVVGIHRQWEEGERKTVLLTGCASSNGTTTVAINLAIALAAVGWKTLLVDVDLRKGNVFKHVGHVSEVGLTGLLAGEASLSEAVRPTNHEGLFFQPSGDMPGSAIRLLCSAGMAKYIDDAKREYDFILFDAPSITVVPDASVLFPVVDGVILVAALDRTTKMQLASARQEADKAGDKYYGLVVNCVKERQYKRYFPQYDYFYSERLKKARKEWLPRQGGKP